MQDNAFENVVCEMSTILSEPQCVHDLCRYPGITITISIRELIRSDNNQIYFLNWNALGDH